jgi:outer membrane protein OmpA-like peptidoglycan-associated protein
VTGLYIGGGAGLNFMSSSSRSWNANWQEFQDGIRVVNENYGGGRSGSNRNPGFVGLGSIGWGFGNGLRAELEGSFRRNSIKSVGVCNTFGNSDCGGGTSSNYAVMVNALYDFNNVAPWVVPYVGAGIGYGWQSVNNAHLPSRSGWSDIGLDRGFSGTTGNLAWQVIAGAAFPIAAVPGLSITAEYRFFSIVSGGTIGSRNYSACFGEGYCESASASVKAGASYNHSVLLGARYEFNKAPAPVPVAAAAPVPAARSFMVFFDWDKYNLTDRARAVIRDAAATSKSVQHTRIEVNGYADTSGNPKYNMGLSMRRAQTVAAELVRNGVAKNEIAIKAFGDTVLLVPTGPGVREPQNRRVEIIIR